MAIARRSTSRRRYVLLVIILTAVTLITLDTRNGRSGPLGALGRAAHTVVGPVEEAVDSVASPVSDWWSGVFDAGDIKKDNTELRQKLSEAEGKQHAAQQAIDENEALRNLLGLGGLFEVERVNARIISRDISNFDSSLTIDHGSDDGIERDMPVVGPDGYLVGSITEVGRDYAKVRLLTDPAFAVGVQAPPHPPSTAATGTAAGQVGSDELLVEDFDPQLQVLEGDQIVTSPLSTKFPADMLVGSVSRVENLPGGFSRNVFVKPYVDLGALEFVSVLKWRQGDGMVVKTTTTTTTTTVPAPTTTIAAGG
jgi:rod shape-determining protein MreC